MTQDGEAELAAAVGLSGEEQLCQMMSPASYEQMLAAKEAA